MAIQRLQKILASAGIGSRRNCEEIILEGMVAVNGKIVSTLPIFADPDNDVITVNGKKINKAKKVYYLLNKPKGVICTNSDPQGRPTAIDLVPSAERIFCVGRLDTDTTGLILLTNDNELTNCLTHPRYEIPKTYIASVGGKITSDAVEKLKTGVWLSEGKISVASIKILKRGHSESLIQIVIKQSINRQIHRMLAKVGYKVTNLKRIKIGKIDSSGLSIGKFRPLTGRELEYLNKFTSGFNGNVERQ